MKCLIICVQSLLLIAAITATPQGGLTNVALNKPATQSSEYGQYTQPEKVVDGNKASNIRECTHTSGHELNPWWRVDLQGDFKIFAVVITNRGDCCGDRLSNFDVYVTDDVFDPKLTRPDVSQRCVHQDTAPGQGATVRYDCNQPVTGQYITLVLNTEDGYLNFCELEALGTTIDNGGIAGQCILSPDDVSNRGDCCGDRLSNFDVYVTDGVFDPKLTRPDISQRCVHQDTAPGQGATVRYNCSQPVTGRYITLVLNTEDGYLNFCELEALGTGKGWLTNVALNKPASQSSGHGAYTQPEKVVDGIRATNIRECTHTSGHELNPWWRVDLQGDFKIFAVVITNRGDCCGDRLSNFDVYVTDNVFDPKLTRPDVSQRCVHQDTAHSEGATVRYNCNQPVTGQYITLVLNTEDEYLNFCELEALGTAVDNGWLTNVALYKPASQSSGHGEYTQPEKVVDGIRATNIRECTHTSGHELNPWWRVDLQDVFKIFAVVITNRGDCCGDRLSNFDVYVTDGVFDPKLTRPDVSRRCVHQDTAPGQGATVRYDCNQPITGQYITLVLNTEDGYLNFCELEALGTTVDNGGLTNVALYKPASQSSGHGDYTQPEKVVDGNRATNIRECTHTSGHELNPWWRVDLQGDFKIFAVVITNRGDCCGDRLSNFDVYVTDGVFDPKLTRPDVSQRCVHQDTAPGQGATVRYNCSQPVTGRYITLVLNTEDGYLNFCELEVLGTGKGWLTNVALNKPASQSSGHGAYTQPEKVVDGIRATNIRECTHTSGHELNPWWRVDLQGDFKIFAVVITNRGDCCGDRLSNFDVYVTDDVFDPKLTRPDISQRCVHQDTAHSEGATVRYNCNQPITGQYITLVLNTEDEYLNFCELEALGTAVDNAIPEDWLGSACNSNSDCEASNSTCQEKKCVCQEGFAYSMANKTCENMVPEDWLGSACNSDSDCEASNSTCQEKKCVCQEGFTYREVHKTCEERVKSFQWDPSLRNGSVIHRCVGDNVIFRWPFMTGINETILAVFLFSEQNGTLATSFASHESTVSDRVQYITGPGMILNEVTVQDSGLYGVAVRLMMDSAVQFQQHTYVTELIVIEPPQQTDGRLQVVKEVQQVTTQLSNKGTYDMRVLLKCGSFQNLGFPALSGHWIDPEGNNITATEFQDGFFLLSLPAYHKGGNYTCAVVLNPETFDCLSSDVPLATSASIFLETAETKVQEQGESLQQLTVKLEEVKNQTVELQNGRLQDEIGQTIQHLENSTEYIAQELKDQKVFVQNMNKMNQEEVLSLKDRVNEDLQELKTELGQSLQEKENSLSQEIETVSDGLAKERVALADQENDIKSLEQNTEALRNQIQEEQKYNTQFTTKLETVLNALEEQKSLTARLVTRLEKQQQENQELKATNSEQQQNLTELQSMVSDLVKRLEKQEASSAELEETVTSHEQEFSSKLSELGTTMDDIRTNLTRSIETGSSSNATQGPFIRNELQTRLTQLEGSFTNVERSVNATKSELSSQISSISSRLSSTQSQYQTLQSQVQSLDTSLQATNQRTAPIRLVGGRNSREGRVEMRVGQRWGTICDDGWDNNDAKVVCHMLGFFQSGAQARSSASFGEGSGPIVLDDVNCDGSEQDIRVCSARGFGTHNCAHSEDAGVVCAG